MLLSSRNNRIKINLIHRTDIFLDQLNQIIFNQSWINIRIRENYALKTSNIHKKKMVTLIVSKISSSLAGRNFTNMFIKFSIEPRSPPCVTRHQCQNTRILQQYLSKINKLYDISLLLFYTI